MNQEEVSTNKTGSFQCLTSIGTDRNYFKVIIKLLNRKLENYNLIFLEWDLSACHTKILVILYPSETPLIRKIFCNDENIWGQIARYFPKEIIQLIGGNQVLKGWSKVIAYKCLQGDSISYDGIIPSLGPKGLSELSRSNKDLVVKCFIENLILRII